jgi:hypothetical protein
MRCDEVKENIIDFIYDENGDPASNAGIREHLRTCPACREEVRKLKQTREHLQLWKEAPCPAAEFYSRRNAVPQRSKGWKYARYAAIAAMALICLLALANTQISLKDNGFTFSTSLFPGRNIDGDYYTKIETRNLLKKALDDSEFRMSEANYLMMQEALDTIERDRWMDLRLIRTSAVRNTNKNGSF